MNDENKREKEVNQELEKESGYNQERLLFFLSKRKIIVDSIYITTNVV